MIKLTTPIAALGLFAVSAVSAELLVSDSFDTSPSGDLSNGIYEEAILSGQNANVLGFNSSTNWANPGAGVTQFADSDGLTYTGWNASGGSLFSDVDTRINYGTTRGITATVASAPSTLYFSYLIQRADTTDSGRVGINFTRNNTPGGPFDFGIAGSEFQIAYRTASGNQTATTSGNSYTAGSTALLVLELNINTAGGTDDSWSLYANPTVAGGLGDDTAVLNGTGQLWDSDTVFGAVQPRVAGASAAVGDWNVDEIRIGTTFDSIAIPEPSSFALLSGLLALGGIMVRRRAA